MGWIIAVYKLFMKKKSARGISYSFKPHGNDFKAVLLSLKLGLSNLNYKINFVEHYTL